MKTAKDVLKAIKDNDVKYVDLRFTDPRGKWQHVTFDQTLIDEDAFADGLMFRRLLDRRLEGDQRIRHDPDARPDFGLHGPVLRRLDHGHELRHFDPASGQPYSRDPRGIAKKAEAYLKSTGIGDTAFFGPEAEFFVFDDVRFSPIRTTPASSRIRRNCRPTRHAYEGGNLGHRMRTKGGYFPVPPQIRRGHAQRNAGGDGPMGAVVEKHHHEVASAHTSSASSSAR